VMNVPSFILSTDTKSRVDSLLQIFIRRANLDAFWSRRPGTVEGMRRLFFTQAEVGDFFGFEMFDRIGPFSHNYDSGIRSAIGSLWQSQCPGCHEEKQKYSSIRKVRSLHTNLHNASAKAASSTLVWRSDKGRFITTTAPSDREWHVRFMSGLHSRIGDRRKRDAAISIEQMSAIQDLLEMEWRDASDKQDMAAQRLIAETACFFLIGYCGSMRGFELPKALLTNLRHSIHLEAGPHGHRPHAGIFSWAVSRPAVMLKRKSWFSLQPSPTLACALSYGWTAWLRYLKFWIFPLAGFFKTSMAINGP